MKYILFLFSLILIGCGGDTSLVDAPKAKAVTESRSYLVFLDIDMTNINNVKDSKVDLSAIGTFSDKSVEDVTEDVVWKSSDESVATVDENGVINALKSGTVTISAEKDSVVDTETITITVSTSKEQKLDTKKDIVDPINLTDSMRDLLDAHNKARAEVGVYSKLNWSDSIAKDAQSYADEMAKSGAWEHDSKNHNGYKNGAYGENLYIGTLKPTLDIVAKAWIDEKAFYHYGVIGDEGTCDDGEICGHYTQVIWKETTRVGCAMSQYKTGEYKDWYIVVCKYQTPGNYIGETPY